jgi:hypothetical protein
LNTTVDQLVHRTGELGALGKTGAVGIGFWVGCVKWIAVGYMFSYFWTAAGAIYLLLRRSVDAEELDKVALDEDESAYELPPLRTEGANAPSVGESPAEKPDEGE